MTQIRFLGLAMKLGHKKRWNILAYLMCWWMPSCQLAFIEHTFGSRIELIMLAHVLYLGRSRSLYWFGAAALFKQFLLFASYLGNRKGKLLPLFCISWACKFFSYATMDFQHVQEFWLLLAALESDYLRKRSSKYWLVFITHGCPLAGMFFKLAGEFFSLLFCRY